MQSIALICQLIEQGVKGPFLIAAPLSKLSKWIAEFKKFAPEINILLYHGNEEERMSKRKEGTRRKKYSCGLKSFPVIISSFEVLIRDYAELKAKVRKVRKIGYEWKLIIVDEGDCVQNFNWSWEMGQYSTGNASNPS